jgi:hypothetical protein
LTAPRAPEELDDPRTAEDRGHRRRVGRASPARAAWSGADSTPARPAPRRAGRDGAGSLPRACPGDAFSPCRGATTTTSARPRRHDRPAHAFTAWGGPAWDARHHDATGGRTMSSCQLRLGLESGALAGHRSHFGEGGPGGPPRSAGAGRRRSACRYALPGPSRPRRRLRGRRCTYPAGADAACSCPLPRSAPVAAR